MSADNITAPAPLDRVADNSTPVKQQDFDVFQDYRNGGPDLKPPKAPGTEQTPLSATRTETPTPVSGEQTLPAVQPAVEQTPGARVTTTDQTAPVTRPANTDQTTPVTRPVTTDQTRPATVPDLSIVSGRDAVYTVKPGDNLWNIANRYLGEQRKNATGADANKPVSAREINELVGKIFEANKGTGRNQIKNRDRIYPNQQLTIPGFGVPEAPKPAEKPPEAPKPAEKPPEEPKPAEKPPEEPKPAEKPPEEPKPAEKPPEEPKPAEKPPEEPKPAEKPPEEPKPAEKPPEEIKPAEVAPVVVPPENFTPPSGSSDNPTVGAEVAAKESEVLLRHFDLIPGKADAAYIDAPALKNYLDTSSTLNADDRRWLTSAAAHLGRIQNSSNDEWGRETSGATKADLEAYPRQEKSFEEQYTARNYVKNNFDKMAGADGILNISELRAWAQKRTEEKASPQELKVIADAESLMSKNHISINHRGVSKNSVNIRLLPRVIENGSRYWYGDFTP